MINRVSANGLNIPSHQASVEVSNVKHEYITVPSTSQVSFGAYSVFDFKEKACLLHELILRFDLPAYTSRNTADTDANWTTTIGAGSPTYKTLFPRLSPAYFFFQRIELVMNNNIIDTIYGVEQFIKNQLFISDEKRKALNFGIGDYNNPSLRRSNTVNGKTYFVPLSTFFNISHMPLLYPKDDIQIRLYMEPFKNVMGSLGNSNDYIAPQITANIIARITKLNPELNSYYLTEINKRPQHYKFHELRYGTFTVIPTGGGTTNLVLNSITGNVDWLVFIIRDTRYTNRESNFTFDTPFKSFSILDATSTNITGGQPISSDQLLHLMGKNWTVSSYTHERNLIWSVSENPNNCAYLYSFGSDPIDSAATGASHNTHRFLGNEQLQINWESWINPSPHDAVYQIEVFAYVQSVIECTATYVKKGTVSY